MCGISASAVATRRRSLALGAAALLGLRHIPVAEGKKNRKNRKGNKRCDRKVERTVAETCGRQFDPCMTSAASLCTQAGNPVVCQVRLRECCGFMGRCEPEAYLTCINELVSTLPVP